MPAKPARSPSSFRGGACSRRGVSGHRRDSRSVKTLRAPHAAERGAVSEQVGELGISMQDFGSSSRFARSDQRGPRLVDLSAPWAAYQRRLLDGGCAKWRAGCRRSSRARRRAPTRAAVQGSCSGEISCAAQKVRRKYTRRGEQAHRRALALPPSQRNGARAARGTCAGWPHPGSLNLPYGHPYRSRTPRSGRPTGPEAFADGRSGHGQAGGEDVPGSGITASVLALGLSYLVGHRKVAVRRLVARMAGGQTRPVEPRGRLVIDPVHTRAVKGPGGHYRERMTPRRDPGTGGAAYSRGLCRNPDALPAAIDTGARRVSAAATFSPERRGFKSTAVVWRPETRRASHVHGDLGGLVRRRRNEIPGEPYAS